MNYDDLPEVRVKGKDGKWYSCKPFVTTVKGGKAVIYPAPDGTEVKREPLARYVARIREDEGEGKKDAADAGKKGADSAPDVPEPVKVKWAINCVVNVAKELNMFVEETADLLDRYGLLAYILEYYGALHVQTYEYMTGLLVGELRKAGGVK